MRIHPGRTILAAVALAELGALAGGALCSAFLVAWATLRYGPFGAQPLLGALLWGAVVGALAGAVALPALGLTVLRHAPLGRALGTRSAVLSPGSRRPCSSCAGRRHGRCRRWCRCSDSAACWPAQSQHASPERARP